MKTLIKFACLLLLSPLPLHAAVDEWTFSVVGFKCPGHDFAGTNHTLSPAWTSLTTFWTATNWNGILSITNATLGNTVLQHEPVNDQSHLEEEVNIAARFPDGCQEHDAPTWPTFRFILNVKFDGDGSHNDWTKDCDLAGGYHVAPTWYAGDTYGSWWAKPLPYPITGGGGIQSACIMHINAAAPRQKWPDRSQFWYPYLQRVGKPPDWSIRSQATLQSLPNSVFGCYTSEDLATWTYQGDLTTDDYGNGELWLDDTNPPPQIFLRCTYTNAP